MREQEQRKIAFQGVIKSVQPRSNVWRYRLDNRTHSMTGYNLFLSGIADGEEKDFAIAISEKQQEKYKQEKEQMEKDMAELNDLDYLEEQARDQMRLIKPGETLYIFPEDMTEEKE